MPPRDKLIALYKQQGWNDEAAINADINAGGWRGKVQTGSPELQSYSSGANVTPPSFTANPVQSAIDIAKTLREDTQTNTI